MLTLLVEVNMRDTSSMRTSNTSFLMNKIWNVSTELSCDAQSKIETAFSRRSRTRDLDYELRIIFFLPLGLNSKLQMTIEIVEPILLHSLNLSMIKINNYQSYFYVIG